MSERTYFGRLGIVLIKTLIPVTLGCLASAKTGDPVYGFMGFLLSIGAVPYYACTNKEEMNNYIKSQSK